MSFSRQQLVWGGVALVAGAAVVVVAVLMSTSSVDTVRAKCYEQAVQRRQVVSTTTNSNTYLDQITADALKNQTNDATAFIGCQQAASLSPADIQTLSQYEAANHFTK